MPDKYFSKEEQKAIFKEAFKEVIRDWLEEQFIKFGKFTAAAFSSLVVVALLYLVLKFNRWLPPALDGEAARTPAAREMQVHER